MNIIKEKVKCPNPLVVNQTQWDMFEKEGCNMSQFILNRPMKQRNIIKEKVGEFRKCYEHSSLFECFDGCEKELTDWLTTALKDTIKSTVESLELEEKTLKADDIMKTKLKGMSYEEAFGRHMENFKIIQEVNKWKIKQLKRL